MSEIFIDGKDAMTMMTLNEFKRHGSSAVIAILGTTGRTKLGMTTKRNKFKVATMSAAIHCTTKRRVTTVNHLVDAFHNDITGMKSILNYFIIIPKNFLQNIHEIIMQQSNQKENPLNPLMNEGQGS